MTSPTTNNEIYAQAKACFDAAVRQHMQSDVAGARQAYESVIEMVPTFAEARNNLATLMAQACEFDAAIAQLREATQLHPRYADAWHNLGLVLNQSGHPAEAVPPLRAAVELEPMRSAWWSDLGNALVESQCFDDALGAYDVAERLAPGVLAPMSNRACALRGLRRLPEAAEACRRALAIEPWHLETLNNFGIILKEMGAYSDAERLYDAAIARHPKDVSLQVNKAALLIQLGRYEEAEAIALPLSKEHPEQPELWNVLYNCAYERADWTGAELLLRRALEIAPHNRNVNWNMAVLKLLGGDFIDGFRKFEARKQLVSVVFTHRRLAQPEWDGSDLEGRSIFVHAEQGLGDCIQFVRYAAVLKARGAARVIIEAEPSHEAVLRTAPGIDAVVHPGSPLPSFDVHAYMMSLPYLCGTTSTEDIPSTVPYLRSPTRPIEQMIVAHGSDKRVGIVWAGNPQHPRDRSRSIALSLLEPVLRTPGVSFFSLQKGEAVSQLEDERFASVVDLEPYLADLGDAAAAISALDLVITVDTAIAHLAGALGKPVWVLLAHVPDWRWMRDIETSPWYPTMRLFRQPAPKEWTPVISGVAQSLVALPAALHRQRVTTVAALPPQSRRIIEIDWQAGLTSGWGTYGLQLTLALHRSDTAEPVLLTAPLSSGLHPLVQQRLHRTLRVTPGERSGNAVRLTAMGNFFSSQHAGDPPRDRRNVGVIFFEDTALDAVAVLRAKPYEHIVAGSTWNAELLKAYGVEHVSMVLQGVDPSVFHPAPRGGAHDGRFYVFSGGKLEFRKGQDIVVEAFKRFHARHRDSVLVTAWHNHWPSTMAGIESAGWVHGLPDVRDQRCDVGAWLVANGVRADAVIDVGALPQAQMSQLLREMDVAVFTNRCEGGTNLVAMEAMACAVPVILSSNTGHLNLIGADTCFALERQASVTAKTPLYRGTFCWGESDPDEVVAQLERVYDDRVEARRRGVLGAQLMAQVPWEQQAAELLKVIGE